MKRSSWKKNLAEIYNHVQEDKVVLSLRGSEAVQYVSNSELIRLGRQIVDSVEASRQTQAELETHALVERQAQSGKQAEANRMQPEAKGKDAGPADNTGDGGARKICENGQGDSDTEIRFEQLNVEIARHVMLYFLGSLAVTV